jgi:hypothetical protein
MTSEDEEIIARFVDPDADGIAMTFPEDGNPFLIVGDPSRPTEVPRGYDRIHEAIEQTKVRHQSLVERTDHVRPRVPPCVTRGTKLAASRAQSAVAVPKPELITAAPSTLVIPQSVAKPARQRSQLMPELIEQKRDVYRFQLFINTKQRRIEKFQWQELKEEQRLIDENKRITDQIEANKQASMQLEVHLVRARKQADLARQYCERKTKELKNVKIALDVLRSQISKNEDQLSQWTPFRGFLEKICPPELTFEAFLSNPKNCIEELHKSEYDNLFLITHYQHINNLFEQGVDNIEDRLVAEIQAEQSVMRAMENQAQPKESSDDASIAAKGVLQDTEAELGEIEKMVQKTYKGCFGVDVDLGVLLMLTRLEQELEAMGEKCDRVVPEFLTYKRTIREKQRREKQRKERLELRAKEQQKNIEQAIARAAKPIPRRTERPLNQRRLPQRMGKQDDEAIRRRLMEQWQEEQLLYHDSEDEF